MWLGYLDMFPGCGTKRHLTLSSLKLAHRHVDKKATIECNGRTVHVRTSPASQEQCGPCNVLGRAKAIRRDLIDNDVPCSFKKLGRHLAFERATGNGIADYALGPKTTREVATEVMQASFGSRIGICVMIGHTDALNRRCIADALTLIIRAGSLYTAPDLPL